MTSSDISGKLWLTATSPEPSRAKSELSIGWNNGFSNDGFSSHVNKPWLMLKLYNDHKRNEYTSKKKGTTHGPLVSQWLTESMGSTQASSPDPWSSPYINISQYSRPSQTKSDSQRVNIYMAGQNMPRWSWLTQFHDMHITFTHKCNFVKMI